MKLNNEVLMDIYRSLPTNDHMGWSKDYFHTQYKRYISDLEEVNKFSNSIKLLEIGGAPFHFTALLQNSGYNVTSIDLDPMRYSEYIKSNNLNVIKLDVEIDKIELSEKYDLVLFTEVFEHLRINPIETLNKIKKLTTKDGLIYITTPNFYSYGNLLSFCKGKGIGNGFLAYEKLEQLGHCGHIREYTNKEMCQFFNHTNLTIVKSYYRSTQHKNRISASKIINFLFNKSKSHLVYLLRNND